MSIKPLPRIFQCSVCRWKKTIVFPHKTASQNGYLLSACPQCGNENIANYQKKTRLERWMEGI